MSIFTIFSGSKKNDAERMQDAAHGRAVLGDLMGSSPYMREWRRRKKEISEDYKKQEKNVRKDWKREDEYLEREFEKEKERFGRRMDEKNAAKYYGTWEAKHRREIQKERSKMLEKMERDEHRQVREIGPTIRQFK